jgi:hypothetical protein
MRAAVRRDLRERPLSSASSRTGAGAGTDGGSPADRGRRHHRNGGGSSSRQRGGGLSTSPTSPDSVDSGRASPTVMITKGTRHAHGRPHTHHRS